MSKFIECSFWSESKKLQTNAVSNSAVHLIALTVLFHNHLRAAEPVLDTLGNLTQQIAV